MLVSIVIPLFNEEESLPLLLGRLTETVKHLGASVDHEILLVNDGSRDRTGVLLAHAARENKRIRVIGLCRNFGHQVAVTAGLDAAEGDAVVVMDADLQDPPELLGKMLELYQQGNDVVSPQRTKRAGESWLKKITAQGFYTLMRSGVDSRLVPQVGDFRLYSRRAVLAMRGLRERHRFLRGMVAWIGLKEAVLPFERAARVAGETKYPFRKMFRFAWMAITSSSSAPLRVVSAVGWAMLGLSLAAGAVLTYLALVGSSMATGLACLAVFQGILAGMLMVSIGLVGDYLARVYEESKGRPIYIVGETINLAKMPHAENALWLPARSEYQSGETLVKKAA